MTSRIKVPHTSLRWVYGALCAAALLALSVTPLQASHLGCGDVIFTDTILDSDLSCPDTGVTIGANNVNVDLGGHTITGEPGATFGIINLEGFNGVTIRNGTVSGFENALRANGATNLEFQNLFIVDTTDDAVIIGESNQVTFRGITVLSNSGPLPGVKAIVLSNVENSTVSNVNIEGYSSGVSLACFTCGGVAPFPKTLAIKNSTFVGNFIAVEITHYTDVTVSNNEIRDGASLVLDGKLFLSAGVQAGSFGFVSGLNVSGNYIHDNGTGIVLDDVINSSVSTNHIMDNSRNGIFLRTKVSGSTGNLVKGNLTAGNGDGINTFDLVHDAFSIPNNWLNNSCDTKFGADIPEC